MKMPKSWRYEYIPMPLDFAPDLPYQGFEELRFSSGMFDTLSTSYFSYAFVLVLREEEGKEPISKRFYTKKGLKEFFLGYFRGLGKAVLESKKIDYDESLVTAKIKRGKKAYQYQAKVVFPDPFTTMKPVNLQMKFKRLEADCPDFYVLVLVSSKDNNAPIWDELHQIEQSLKVDFCH